MGGQKSQQPQMVPSDQIHRPLPLTSGLYKGDFKNRVYPITSCWKALFESTDSSLLGQPSRENLLLTCGPMLAALWFCVRTELVGWENVREAVLESSTYLTVDKRKPRKCMRK